MSSFYRRRAGRVILTGAAREVLVMYAVLLGVTAAGYFVVFRLVDSVDDAMRAGAADQDLLGPMMLSIGGVFASLWYAAWCLCMAVLGAVLVYRFAIDYLSIRRREAAGASQHVTPGQVGATPPANRLGA